MRERHDRFDGLHHLRHALQLRRRHEHRLRSEQVGAALPNHLREARLPELRIERSPQRVLVETEAEALAVERVDGAEGRVKVRRWRDGVHGVSRCVLGKNGLRNC